MSTSTETINYLDNGVSTPIDVTVYPIDKAGEVVRLASDPRVWGAYSAQYLLRVMEENGILVQMQDEEILDLGCGGGILGIAALKKSARSVTMVDLNQAAVELSEMNAKINGFIPGVSFDCVHSDLFDDLPNNQYDRIISNPPVQPELLGVHVNNPAYKTNESGANGRRALDGLITQGRNYLKKGGKMLFTSSSRHKHSETVRMLNENWGEGNWRVINHEDGEGVEDKVMPEYHGPYMMYWVGMQSMDLEFRVYQKDKSGNPYCETVLSPNRTVKLITLPTDNGLKTVKLDMVNGQITRAVEMVGEIEVPIELPRDFEIPSLGEDQSWYYKYYVIEAVNN
ncbi:MAG TPA: methyltransferase [Candidatus Dojkabacteria bacterium]